jgi:hypothetical protein
MCQNSHSTNDTTPPTAASAQGESLRSFARAGSPLTAYRPLKRSPRIAAYKLQQIQTRRRFAHALIQTLEYAFAHIPLMKLRHA